MREAVLNKEGLQDVKLKILQEMGIKDNRYHRATPPLLHSWGRTSTFYDFTYSISQDNTEWMDNKGLSANTRGEHVKNLKTVVNDSPKRGIHKNKGFRLFMKETKEVDVCLTEEKLRRIEELELIGTRQIVRNFFTTGCYTAMRFSDYTRFSVKIVKRTKTIIRKEK